MELMQREKIKESVRAVLDSGRDEHEAHEHYWNLMEHGCILGDSPSGWGAVARFLDQVFDEIRGQLD